MLAAVTSSSQLDDTTCNGRTLASTPGNGESSRRSRAFSVAEFIPAVRRRSTMFFEQRVRLFNKSRFGKMSSHERKATKTLGVIMGAFTACWLPFFILALIKPFCYDQESCIPQWLSSLFLWLGYANSLLNPIIYARFNRDFRTPFKHLLQCHIRDINVRMRTENYTEQYGAGAMAVGPRSSVAGADWLQQPRNSMTSAADVIVRVQCPSNRLTAVTDTMWSWLVKHQLKSWWWVDWIPLMARITICGRIWWLVSWFLCVCQFTLITQQHVSTTLGARVQAREQPHARENVTKRTLFLSVSASLCDGRWCYSHHHCSHRLTRFMLP